MSVDGWGVADGYNDVTGLWRESPAATILAVRAALGAPPDGSGEPPRGDVVRVIRPGESFVLDRSLGLYTEDGGFVALPRRSSLPADLPIGYHRLSDSDNGNSTMLIVAPDSIRPPRGMRSWGWAAQLYALRSRRSWGIGDLGDLATLALSARRMGAAFTLSSPMHASHPSADQQDSPYFPSSRVYRSPLLLRIEDVPGFREVSRELDATAKAARALNGDRRIDRNAVFALKQQALATLWIRFRDTRQKETRAFETWLATQPAHLWDFATFCALSERNTGAWPTWPEEHRHVASTAVASFREANFDRVAFHAWQQWLLTLQLDAATAELPIVSDLAVGVDPNGADAWMWQDCMALGLSVGAPPDLFAADGQDWGLPPFHPYRLREGHYEPIIAMLRSALRGACGIRVDHVMGLFRLFVMPRGERPSEGCYVYLPFWDLLGILSVESHRAGAWVVGEDLGTVEDYVRDELAKRRIFSYRVLQFEHGPTASLPPNALAAVETHDMPTLAGLWSGADVAAQHGAGRQPNLEATEAVCESLAARAGVTRDASLADVTFALHRDLARSPCAAVTVTFEDALGVEERPNMPGTVDEWPNWRLALPLPLEELLEDDRVTGLASVMSMR